MTLKSWVFTNETINFYRYYYQDGTPSTDLPTISDKNEGQISGEEGGGGGGGGGGGNAKK